MYYQGRLAGKNGWTGLKPGIMYYHRRLAEKTRKQENVKNNSVVQQTVGDMSHLIIGSTKAFQMAFIAT
jgi:hypothetical protein